MHTAPGSAAAFTPPSGAILLSPMHGAAAPPARTCRRTGTVLPAHLHNPPRPCARATSPTRSFHPTRTHAPAGPYPRPCKPTSYPNPALFPPSTPLPSSRSPVLPFSRSLFLSFSRSLSLVLSLALSTLNTNDMKQKVWLLPAAALLGALLFWSPFTNAHDKTAAATPLSSGEGSGVRSTPPSLREGGREDGSAPLPLGKGSGDGSGDASAAVAPPKNYRVIYGADLQKLVNDVHTAMLENWQVTGGVAVYVQEGKVRYAQAMVGN
ncbi:DUF1737 domain-containing protein [Flaviaesturariibacter aridisoli]|uniref:DUF1737 domain-containing protein n=1 Tax=Flaviaesturariibacter aridisoli TaxID=2545761 RepID=A0A4R4E3C4_9BACT|nr:DUF1737 domain-containing protein [Flaviaesturariibacter aridisoli]